MTMIYTKKQSIARLALSVAFSVSKIVQLQLANVHAIQSMSPFQFCPTAH